MEKFHAAIFTSPMGHDVVRITRQVRNWLEETGLFTVEPTEPVHPIMEGISPFRTKEELYCGLTNVQDVPLEVLATAHSPKERLSRHGHPGTGNEEPVLTLGQYGKGITVNFLTKAAYEGHVEDEL